MAKPKVKVSPHAKKRFVERTDEERKLFNSLSRLAHKKGLVWQQIEMLYPEYAKTQFGVEIKNYLTAFYGRKKKYYQGYMFIFSGCTRRLVTMFPCKDKYHEELERLWNEVYKENKLFKKISKK